MHKDFIKVQQGGYYCARGGFHLDPRKPAPVAVISHAHADHAVSGNQKVYCTPPTRALMESRYGSRAAGSFVVCEYGVPFETGEVKITFFPAGHILGSAQVLMEHEGCRYLYTGDFKMQEDATCEPFVQVKADVLITETTFASPSRIHPCPEQEIDRLGGIERTIVIGAYAIGKAQRVTALLARNTGRRIVVHPEIAAFHKVYEAHGIALGSWESYTPGAIKDNPGSVYVVPPRVFARYRRNPSVARAFASGWDHLQQEDIRLQISDHADWNDLIRMVSHSGATTVLTVHGKSGDIIRHFSGTGIKVAEL
jgi:putative mRNA 3-end processing factor